MNNFPKNIIVLKFYILAHCVFEHDTHSQAQVEAEARGQRWVTEKKKERKIMDKQRDESRQHGTEELLPFSETLIKTCASSCLHFVVFSFPVVLSPQQSREEPSFRLLLCSCEVGRPGSSINLPLTLTPPHTLSFSPLNRPGLHCLRLTVHVTQNTLQISTEIPDRL